MFKNCIQIFAGLVGIVFFLESNAEISAEELIIKIRPSIVGITVAPSLPSSLQDTQPNDTPLPAPATTITLKGHSVGTGTIISKNGLILTDSSVVSLKGEITVTLDDGTKHIAKIIGLDNKTGFAVIKISKTNLASINIIYPRPLALGQNLIAFGRTSLGSISTPVATNGIVSGFFDGDNLYGGIQSTISVQPGMGGAPVFSLKTGEIIGLIQVMYQGGKFAPITFSTRIEEYLKIESRLSNN